MEHSWILKDSFIFQDFKARYNHPHWLNLNLSFINSNLIFIYKKKKKVFFQYFRKKIPHFRSLVLLESKCRVFLITIAFYQIHLRELFAKLVFKSYFKFEILINGDCFKWCMIFILKSNFKSSKISLTINYFFTKTSFLFFISRKVNLSCYLKQNLALSFFFGLQKPFWLQANQFFISRQEKTVY